MNKLYRSAAGRTESEEYWKAWAKDFYSQDQLIVATPNDWWERVQRVLKLEEVS